jgi:PAS domain S-box-containing protein
MNLKSSRKAVSAYNIIKDKPKNNKGRFTAPAGERQAGLAAKRLASTAGRGRESKTKPLMPQSLERVLRRLLVYRLVLPLTAALLGILVLSAVPAFQTVSRQQNELARALALAVDGQRGTDQEIEAMLAGWMQDAGWRGSIDLLAPGEAAPQTGLHLDPQYPGQFFFTSLAPVDTNGRSVVVRMGVFSNLGGLALGALLTLAVAIGLTVALVLSYGHRLRSSVAAPLASLNQRAARMASGDFIGDISFNTVASGFHEVAELAGSFERMQEAVRKRQIVIEANEKRFRAMAELLPDMVFEIDVQRNIQFANRAVSRLIGYTQHDFEAGMNLDQLVAKADQPALETALVEVTRDKTSRLLTLNMLRRTRQLFAVEFSLAANRNESGELAGYRCVARDISERIKSEEALQRSFQLFTAGPVIVFRVNTAEQRQVEYVSPNIVQLGYTPEQFIQAPDFFDGIIHPHDLARVENETTAQMNNGAAHFSQEYRLRDADGNYRWVFAFTSLTRNGGGRPAHLDWYIMEIGEHKKNEERIQVQLQRLGALQTIGAFIENNADLNFTLKTIIVQLIEMMRVDGAALLRYDKSADRLTYLVHDGFYIEDPRRYNFRIGEGYAGMAALSRQPVPITADPGILAAEFKFPAMARERFSAYYGLPLLAKGELQGVLEIFSRKRLGEDPEWFDFLETLAGQAAIAIHNADLLEHLQHSRDQIQKAYEDTIVALAKTIDLHDAETQEHSRRLRDLTEKLARHAGLEEEAVQRARTGALIHDIGKIGIPSALLRKQGELTPEERDWIQQHPLLADRILGEVEYLRPSMDIPLCHHEKYDGSGYPRKLKGEEIPLAARIFAIADVWDALTNERPYRSGQDRIWSHERAINYLKLQKGKAFDPRLVDLFVEMMEGV